MRKIQEQLKKEFLERMKNREVTVSGATWRMPLDEYMEQESWRRNSEIDKNDKVC